MCVSSNGSILVDLILVFQNQTVVPTGAGAEQVLQAAIAFGIVNITDLDISTITASKLNTRFTFSEQ